MSKRKFEALTTPTSIEPPPLPLSTSAAASVIDRVNYHDASPTQTNTAAFVPEHLSKTSTDNPGSKPEPQSTPHLAKIIGRVPYTRIEEKWDAREFQVKLFQDSEASILGFMPVDTFLETFLPWRRGSVHVPGKSPYFPSYTIDLEKDMYKPFIESVQNLNLKTLNFVDTHSDIDPNSHINGISPDMSVYTKGHNGRRAGLDFGDMELWLEFKSAQHDFFHDVAGSDLKNKLSEDAEAEVGQLLTYAVSHLGSGFFTHTYSVFIFGGMARLFRWDRAGGIVSEAFDYVKEGKLAEFFLRFDQLTPEQRGRDASVTCPSPKNRNQAQAALAPIRAADESKEDFERRKSYLDPETFVEYLVNDIETGETLRFIGPPPLRPLLYLQGRASRGSPVYDVQTGDVCYLKDTWRINSESQPREGTTYQKLHDAKVRHIATVVAHGDVSSPNTGGSASCGTEAQGNFHVTQTDKYSAGDESWCKLKPLMQSYRHYRIVLDMVGRDLSSFESSKELLITVLDAMIAHGDAYEKASILHRDISPGNIMITNDGRGFLIDWDLAKDTNSKGARSLGRTGTLKFISGLLLMSPNSKMHEFSDDLESFLHVLTYVFIRFTKSNFDPQQVLDYIENTFENSAPEHKGAMLGSGLYIPRDLKFEGRNKLSTGLIMISLEFEGLYRRAKTKKAMKRASERHTWLNKVTGCGGEAVQGLIRELIQTSDEQWTSKVPSELIPLPLSEARQKLRRYVKMLRLTTSYQPSASLKNRTENPYNLTEPADEPSAKVQKTGR